MMILIVIAFSVQLCIADFFIGRVHPNPYDLEELNGRMKSSDAVMLCENHPHCAGFTYKGLNASNDLFADVDYDMYFFRFVDGVNEEENAANWVTYIPEKMYTTYDGHFFESNSHEFESSESIDESNFHLYCPIETCAGLVVDNENRTIYRKITNMSLDYTHFFPSYEGRGITLFNIHILDHMVKDHSIEVDVCCPDLDLRERKFTKLTSNVNDTLPRIPCNMSVADFTRNYIKTRTPVMLVNCTDAWKSSWTNNTIFFNHFDCNTNWYTETNLDLDENVLCGRDVLNLMAKNNSVTVTVFDKIGVAPRRRREDSTESSEKPPELFKMYEKPMSVPEDLFKNTIGGWDYKWVIAATAGTGSDIHLDPDLTDAWNSLLQGRKYWVLLPKDVECEDYLCHGQCSLPFPERSPQPWYSHVLPELRKKTWYGQRLIEAIQHPGETIYVPSYTAHSVLNLDETLSVTENFMGVQAAMSELPLFHALEWEVFELDGEDSSTHELTKTIWRNMMGREFSVEERRFAQAMWRQIMKQKEARFEQGQREELAKIKEEQEQSENNELVP